MEQNCADIMKLFNRPFEEANPKPRYIIYFKNKDLLLKFLQKKDISNLTLGIKGNSITLKEDPNDIIEKDFIKQSYTNGKIMIIKMDYNKEFTMRSKYTSIKDNWEDINESLITRDRLFSILREEAWRINHRINEKYDIIYLKKIN